MLKINFIKIYIDRNLGCFWMDSSIPRAYGLSGFTNGSWGLSLKTPLKPQDGLWLPLRAIRISLEIVLSLPRRPLFYPFFYLDKLLSRFWWTNHLSIPTLIWYIEDQYLNPLSLERNYLHEKQASSNLDPF